MASNRSLRLALIAILATFVLIGCGEKEPEYKVEGPKASDMPEVGGVASSNGATSTGKPSSGPDGVGPSEIGAKKGDPPGIQLDHK